ncbi:hypothetical protein [Nitrosococcus wardiae]|uniref:hypothetical protein n=1 Tax=Nitrosococcus wardiae TaxID=1814290 RepID=UPI00141B7555|nr:hypothetical protein [Nitrosococcus wardiae]
MEIKGKQTLKYMSSVERAQANYEALLREGQQLRQNVKERLEAVTKISDKKVRLRLR